MRSPASLQTAECQRLAEGHDELYQNGSEIGVPETFNVHLSARLKLFESKVRRSDKRRRAMLHIIRDLNQTNKHLANQQTAMILIPSNHEQDRTRLPRQATRIENSRRSFLHILRDGHQSNLRHLGNTAHVTDYIREIGLALWLGLVGYACAVAFMAL